MLILISLSFLNYYNNIRSFKLISFNSKSTSSHAKCGTLAPGVKELFRKLTSVCPSSRSVMFTLLAKQRSLIIFELVMADNFMKFISGYRQFFELYPAFITVKKELKSRNWKCYKIPTKNIHKSELSNEVLYDPLLHVAAKLQADKKCQIFICSLLYVITVRP